MDLREKPVVFRKQNKENIIKRSLSKRKSLMGIARIGTPSKKKLRKFVGELNVKIEKAVECSEVEPKERYAPFLSYPSNFFMLVIWIKQTIKMVFVFELSWEVVLLGI